MSQHPIRKLNKRAIYWGLIGLIALSMPALISLASFGKSEKSIEKKQKEAHPNVNVHDAKAITGTEHFPETYSDVKGFEKEIASKNSKEETVIQALTQLEEQAPLKRNDLGHHFSGYSDGRDDDGLSLN